ncbi:HAD family hydrolase [Cesiribacter sp. SM1]|uniref:HAD family hydrolase n=1 Tax=Cesiribacter sp. SM1 TaxID=2861196 RepID=UPI001CD2BE7C
MINKHTALKNNIDSIIFDLDGTLWDSTATVAKAWQSAIDKVDFVEETMTQEKVRSITGMPYDAIYLKLYPGLSQEQRTTLMRICGEEELVYLRKEGGVLYPGLVETLTYLKEKYPLFIVSNCQSGYIEAFLEHYQLHRFFTDIECFGNTNQPKSSNIRAVIERNSLQSPVYVGDTMGDYQASQGAKVPFIYTTFGFGEVPEADAVITQFTDLKELL